MTTRTYLLIDGENIDATLGLSVLGHRPQSDERPRWDRVLAYTDGLAEAAATGEESEPARGLFFLQANGQLPMPFVQALLAMDFRPIPLAGEGKVVDIGIKRTLTAILPKEHSRVVLASHDGDFVPEVADLLRAGHEVAVICFREFLSTALVELVDEGLEIHDLELDVHAFTVPLPRVRVIPLDEFDPELYL